MYKNYSFNANLLIGDTPLYSLFLSATLWMRENLARLIYKLGGGPEIARSTSRDAEKSTAPKLCNRQSKIFEKKQNSLDYSWT